MSTVYFECSNCGNVNKVKSHGIYMAICNNCTAKNEYGFSEGISIHKFKLKSLLNLLDKLNIQWGYDEINWNPILGMKESHIHVAYGYDGKCFVKYLLTMHSSDKFETRINNDYNNNKFFNTLEQAQQYCTKDFAKRKEEQ